MYHVWQATIVDSFGNVIPSAQVEVKLVSSGALAPIYSDVDGATPLLNPFPADADGFARFYATDNRYRIRAYNGSQERVWEHVELGLFGAPRPWMDGALIYNIGGDGVVDDTEGLQDALDAAASAGVALFIARPPVKYCIDPLIIPSNSRVLIAPGTTIEARLGYNQVQADSERVLQIVDVNNIVIEAYGVTITFHPDYVFTAEFNHGVRIVGSSNVWIYGLTVQGSGGDGFFIGATVQAAEDTTLSHEVWLVDCVAIANRRNGISLTSGRNIYLIRPRCKDHPATILGCGIDIEPNSIVAILENIVIADASTSGNRPGIALPLQNLSAASVPISVRIYNHVSVGDYIGFYPENIRGVRGTIHYTKGDIRESLIGGIICYNKQVGATLYIDEPKVYNCNTSGNSGVQFGSGIALMNESASTGAGALGDVVISKPTVIDDRGVSNTHVVSIALQDFRTVPVGLSNVHVLDPIVLSGAENQHNICAGAVNWVDAKPASVLSMGDASVTWAGTNRFAALVHNGEATTTRGFTLPSRADYPDITFEVRAAFELRVQPDGSSAILFGGATAGQYLFSNVVGSRLTLRRKSVTEWQVLHVVGKWNVQGAGSYTVTNLTTDRAFNADASTTEELADVLGTLLTDLKAKGILP